MSVILHTPDQAASPAVTGSPAQWVTRPQFGVGLFLLAILQQCLGHHNADNSWLFTVCERMLDGAQPYVELIETNPPASFLIYLPAALLARMAHVRLEFMASACVFVSAALSLWFSCNILRRAGLWRRDEAGVVCNAAIFAFLLLPGFSFAEREHIAAIAVLPALAIYSVRAEGGAPRFGDALFAGLLAGVAISLKPHFALALGLPLLWLAWRRRSLASVMGAENLAAAAVGLAYVGVVLALFPHFFDVLPSILDTYVPIREPLRILLLHPWFLAHAGLLIAAGYAASASRIGSRIDARVVILASASLGFAAAFLVQGKGWVNHGLPGVELALMALVIACAPMISALANGVPNEASLRLRPLVFYGLAPVMLGLSILFGSVLQFSQKREYPGLIEAVQQVAPPHPKVIALSGDLDVGHPLVRAVDGVWVGQAHSLWLMLCAQLIIDSGRGADPRFAAYVERDGRMFAENVRQRHPDVILVSKGERVDLMMRQRDVADVMQTYMPSAFVEEVTVWIARPRP